MKEQAEPRPVRGTLAQRKPMTAGRALAKRLADELHQQPGLGECLQLCDASLIEHVCELALGELEAARLEQRGALPALDTELVAPLRRFLGTLHPMKGQRARGQRMEVEPTLALIAASNAVSVALAGSAPSVDEARRLVADLRLAWFVWLGYVATYWLTFKTPALLVQKQVNREQGRLGGKAPKPAGERSASLAQRIVGEYKRLLQTHAPSNVASIVAGIVGCTPKHVRTIWRRDGPGHSVPHEKANRKAGV